MKLDRWVVDTRTPSPCPDEYSCGAYDQEGCYIPCKTYSEAKHICKWLNNHSVHAKWLDFDEYLEKAINDYNYFLEERS